MLKLPLTPGEWWCVNKRGHNEKRGPEPAFL
jgi:hypothetical protein